MISSFDLLWPSSANSVNHSLKDVEYEDYVHVVIPATTIGAKFKSMITHKYRTIMSHQKQNYFSYKVNNWQCTQKEIQKYEDYVHVVITPTIHRCKIQKYDYPLV